jgi:hypothetical protein
MKIVEDIKNYIGRWQLKQETGRRKQKSKLIAFDQVVHIGILYHADNKEHEQMIAKYAGELRAEGKKVFMMGYVDAKLLPPSKKFLLNSEYFWKEKLNGFNLPIKGKIGQFLQLEFDLLLNLYTEPLLPLQAIAAYSNAKYRVGSQIHNGLEFYDAIIDTGSQKSLRYFIEQIDFYLRQIK